MTFDKLYLCLGSQPTSPLYNTYCGVQDGNSDTFELDAYSIYIRFRSDESCCDMQGFSLYYSTEAIDPNEAGE